MGIVAAMNVCETFTGRDVPQAMEYMAKGGDLGHVSTEAVDKT